MRIGKIGEEMETPKESTVLLNEAGETQGCSAGYDVSLTDEHIYEHKVTPILSLRRLLSTTKH